MKMESQKKTPQHLGQNINSNTFAIHFHVLPFNYH